MHKTPVNKTYLQRVTPSEKLAKAYEKQMKKAEKQNKNPEAVFRKLERKRDKNKRQMALKKSLDTQQFTAFRRKMRMRSIYSSYH